MTFAPASTARVIPAAASAALIPPVEVIRTGRSVVAPATPLTPSPLPSTAEISPATNVPCPTASRTAVVPVSTSQAGPIRPARSGCVTSTPLSTTATVTGKAAIDARPARAFTPTPAHAYWRSVNASTASGARGPTAANSVRSRGGSIQSTRGSSPTDARTAEMSPPDTSRASMWGIVVTVIPSPRNSAATRCAACGPGVPTTAVVGAPSPCTGAAASAARARETAPRLRAGFTSARPPGAPCPQ